MPEDSMEPESGLSTLLATTIMKRAFRTPGGTEPIQTSSSQQSEQEVLANCYDEMLHRITKYQEKTPQQLNTMFLSYDSRALLDLVRVYTGAILSQEFERLHHPKSKRESQEVSGAARTALSDAAILKGFETIGNFLGGNGIKRINNILTELKAKKNEKSLLSSLSEVAEAARESHRIKELARTDPDVHEKVDSWITQLKTVVAPPPTRKRGLF